MVLLAQATVEEICGVEADGGFLCRLMAEVTDAEILLRSAGVIGTVLRVIAILLVAYIVSRLARAAIGRFGRTMQRRIERRLARDERRGAPAMDKYRSRRFQRLSAVNGVLRGAVAVVVWFVAILAIVETLGVSLQPVLAGAGLAGVVIGFGAQQLVRDVLAGIAMLIEDQYGIGDWINVDGVIGQVERVGLRVTSFRDLDGVVHHVLNGYIQRVGNLSQEWSRSMLDVPVALDTDVPTAKALIHKIATELAQDPVWGQDIIGPPEIWGMQDFGPDGLSIRVVMPTKPMANWDINRQMRERLHHAFERAQIRMPGDLVELGGMPRGYPVLNQRIEEERRSRRPMARPTGDRDPAPEAAPDNADTSTDPVGTGPYEQRRRTPGAWPDDRTESIEPVGDQDLADLADLADRTTELRLTRGREPRPD